MLGPVSIIALSLLARPDLEPTELRGADPAAPGEVMWLQHAVTNTGNQPAGAFRVRFYYIANPIIPVWNNPIGEYVVPAGLQAGQTHQALMPVTLPDNILPLLFHQYGIDVDADDTVNEQDENNNRRRTSFYTVFATDVDLELFRCAVPPRPRPGATVSVDVEVRNLGGNGLGRTVPLAAILSVDDIPTRNDAVIGTQDFTNLGAGASRSVSLSVTIPSGTPSGSQRYVGCWIDRDGGNYPYDGDQVEDDETNNIQMIPIIVTDVDLVADALVVEGGLGGPGEIILVSGSVRNAGGTNAAAHRLRFIESASPTDPSGGTVLGELARPSLGAGQTALFANHPLTLPAVLPSTPTTRYIHVLIDPDDNVPEYDETNNTRAAPYALRQLDLIVERVFGPASGASGELVSVDVDVRNRGTVSAPASTVALFENATPAVGGGPLLGSGAVPALAAGQVVRVSVVGVLPAHGSPAATTRYFVAQADSGGVITESDETNNVLARSYLVDTYDLVVDGFGAPTAAGDGQTVSFVYAVRNAGGTVIPSFEIVVRLSTDAVFDGTDTELRRIAIGPLAAGESRVGTIAGVVLPALPGVEGSTLFFGLELDPDDAIVELNEANNSASSPFAVRQRDLELLSMTLNPNQTSAGGNVTVSYSVRNNGLGNVAAGAQLRFFDSIDAVFDLADPALSTVALPAVAPGATISGTRVVVVPLTAVAGVRYVFGVVDPANVIPEYEELNNLRIAPLSIDGTIDLVAQNITAPASVYAGQSISLPYQLQNTGNVAVGNVDLRFVLSLDASPSLANAPLGQVIVPALASGASSSGSINVVVPDIAPVGATVYFALLVDPQNLVPESNEANNIALDDAFVDGPDLVAVEFAPVGATPRAAPFALRYEVQNNSAVAVGPVTAHIVRSDDASLDLTDDLLLSFELPALGANATTIDQVDVSLPTGTPLLAQGTLFLVLDPLQEVTEGDENNNVLGVPYTAENTPPVAVVVAPASLGEGESAVLSAAGSVDPDGGALSYRWQQLSGPALSLSGASSASLALVAPTVCADDLVTLELEVCDAEGACDQAVVAISVQNLENDLPVLVIDVLPGTLVGENLTVTLDASATTDCNGDAVALLWTQEEGPIVSLSDVRALAPTFSSPSVLAPELLVFRVAACDGPASCTEQTLEVLVIDDQNELPVAVIASSLTLFEREAGAFDGSASYDPNDDGLVEYRWSTLSGPAVTITGTTAGRFVAPRVRDTSTVSISLVVVDDRGGESLPALAELLILAYPDTDGDGLDDPEENDLQTDPTRPDTDGDGLTDGVEFEAGIDPLDRDTDDDGLIDGDEPGALEDHDADELIGALDPDSDNDGVLDGTEAGVTEPDVDTDLDEGSFVPDADSSTTTEVLDPDTDGDGYPDGVEDSNRNGRVDPGESDPNDPNDPGTPPDAGQFDASPVPDAAADGGAGADAQVAPDSGVPDGQVGGGGCGCSSAQRQPVDLGLAFALVLMAAGVWRRRTLVRS